MFPNIQNSPQKTNYKTYFGTELRSFSLCRAHNLNLFTAQEHEWRFLLLRVSSSFHFPFIRRVQY